MYDAFQAYQETKDFEAYLIVQNRILNECKNEIKETLLQKLIKVYQTGGREDDLMNVLRGAIQ